MSEWKEYKLGDIAKLRREGFMPEEQITLPYIGLEHIESEALQLIGIGSSNDVSSQKSKFYPGDILYGKLRPYFRKAYSPNFNGVCSTDIFVIKPTENICPKFLFYLVASESFTSIASSGSTGTRMPRADWKHLSNTIWSVPPLPTQTAIAEILSSLDDKIELNKTINKNLEDLAQALFKHWFVDFDFPDNNGQPYKSSGGEMVNSELGMIPKGWSVTSLNEIAEYLNGLALQKHPPETEKDSLPVIKIKELRQGITNASDRASRNIPDKYIVKNGDVLFAWSGSLMIDFWTNGRGALNQHLFKVSSDTFPKWFYFYWTKNHLDEFIKIAESKATTMGHIQRKHLAEAKVLIPNNAQLERFSNVFSPVVDRIINGRLESNELNVLRDTLLPKLISGELEVSNQAK